MSGISWIRRLALRKHPEGKSPEKRGFGGYALLAVHAVVWICVLSIGLQLWYPGDTTLPGTRIEGEDVGRLPRRQLLAQLDRRAADARLTITAADRTRRLNWSETGVALDRDATARAALSYAWWERLVPFSLTVRMYTSDYPLVVVIDRQRLGTFAERIAAEQEQAAKDASVTFVNGRVRVDEAKAGYTFNRADIERRLVASAYRPNAAVELRAESLPALRARAEIEAAVGRAEQVLGRDVTLRFAGQVLTIDRVLIGEWLQVAEDPDTGRLRLGVNQPQLRDYLNDLNQRFAVPAGTTSVLLRDGRKVRETAGKPGQAMDVAMAVARIERLLLGKADTIVAVLPVEPVAPKRALQRTYSQTSAGLRATVDDWVRSSKGTYSVVVRELDRSQRVAEIRSHKRYQPANTYKLFLAYAVLLRMQDGKIEGHDKTDMGWTVDACITEMMVNGTEPCAVSLHTMVGREKADDFIRDAGFTETVLNNQYGGEKVSTAHDEADFLARLQQGSLLTRASTNRLLGLLKRQVWRGGIPSPSAMPYGTVVASSVGMQGDYAHDVAIVYGPRSTYVLAVMSQGGSDPAFAELSRRVYTFFDR